MRGRVLIDTLEQAKVRPFPRRALRRAARNFMQHRPTSQPSWRKVPRLRELGLTLNGGPLEPRNRLREDGDLLLRGDQFFLTALQRALDRRGRLQSQSNRSVLDV